MAGVHLFNAHCYSIDKISDMTIKNVAVCLQKKAKTTESLDCIKNAGGKQHTNLESFQKCERVSITEFGINV